jgi:hypothetical protein
MLQANGVEGLHFYTLNLERSTIKIMEGPLWGLVTLFYITVSHRFFVYYPTLMMLVFVNDVLHLYQPYVPGRFGHDCQASRTTIAVETVTSAQSQGGTSAPDLLGQSTQSVCLLLLGNHS